MKFKESRFAEIKNKTLNNAKKTFMAFFLAGSLSLGLNSCTTECDVLRSRINLKTPFMEEYPSVYEKYYKELKPQADSLLNSIEMKKTNSKGQSLDIEKEKEQLNQIVTQYKDLSEICKCGSREAWGKFRDDNISAYNRRSLFLYHYIDDNPSPDTWHLSSDLKDLANSFMDLSRKIKTSSLAIPIIINYFTSTNPDSVLGKFIYKYLFYCQEKGEEEFSSNLEKLIVFLADSSNSNYLKELVLDKLQTQSKFRENLKEVCKYISPKGKSVHGIYDLFDSPDIEIRRKFKGISLTGDPSIDEEVFDELSLFDSKNPLKLRLQLSLYKNIRKKRFLSNDSSFIKKWNGILKAFGLTEDSLEATEKLFRKVGLPKDSLNEKNLTPKK
ncbi:MAG: hypothetical protein ACK4J0_00205 [Candidatus Anstonellaceae archaeon]